MVHIIHTINDGSFRLPQDTFKVRLLYGWLNAIHIETGATIRWPISQILCWETAPAEDIGVPDPNVWVTETRRDLPA